MAMILAVPSVFVACFVAWWITRRTGPLPWWRVAGGLQVLLHFLWCPVLVVHAGLSDGVALPLASGLGVVTIALMSALLRVARRNERPYDDPRSRVVLRRMRRATVVAMGVCAVLVTARTLREINRPRVPRFDDILPAPYRPSPELVQLALPAGSEALASSSATPKRDRLVGADRLRELEEFKAGFVSEMRRVFPTLEGGPIVETTLPYAEHIHIELVAPGETPRVGWADVYRTDKGALLLLSLADATSYSNPRSAFSRAVARINAAVPPNVDRAPADYIQLDRSWKRVPSLSPGSVKFVRKAGRPPHVRFGMVMALYVDGARLF